jgi:hypothetical protein
MMPTRNLIYNKNVTIELSFLRKQESSSCVLLFWILVYTGMTELGLSQYSRYSCYSMDGGEKYHEE